MSLLKSIRSRQLAERKNRGENCDHVAIAILTVLLGDIEKLAKEKRREVMDDEIYMLIRRLLKTNSENQQIYGDRRDGNMCDELEHEKDILESFLPQQLGEDQIRSEVSNIIQEMGATEAKHMGGIMKVLKERHGAAVDMKMASNMARSLLQG
jgi:uncharacterized protein